MMMPSTLVMPFGTTKVDTPFFLYTQSFLWHSGELEHTWRS